MSKFNLNEGLGYKDLAGMLKNTLYIDDFASKMWRMWVTVSLLSTETLGQEYSLWMSTICRPLWGLNTNPPDLL